MRSAVPIGMPPSDWKKMIAPDDTDDPGEQRDAPEPWIDAKQGRPQDDHGDVHRVDTDGRRIAVQAQVDVLGREFRERQANTPDSEKRQAGVRMRKRPGLARRDRADHLEQPDHHECPVHNAMQRRADVRVIAAVGERSAHGDPEVTDEVAGDAVRERRRCLHDRLVDEKRDRQGPACRSENDLLVRHRRKLLHATGS